MRSHNISLHEFLTSPLILFCLYLVFFEIFFVTYFEALQEIVVSLYPAYYSSMGELSTPILPFTKVSLNYVGFILPLILSLLYLRKVKEHGQFLKRDGRFMLSLVIIFTVLVVSLLISLFVYELRFITSNGGGVNIPAFFSGLFFLAFTASRINDKLGISLSYIFGFLIGIVSDAESLTHLTKPTIFGGVGFFDADFALPLVFGLGFIALLVYNKFIDQIFKTKLNSRQST